MLLGNPIDVRDPISGIELGRVEVISTVVSVAIDESHIITGVRNPDVSIVRTTRDHPIMRTVAGRRVWEGYPGGVLLARSGGEITVERAFFVYSNYRDITTDESHKIRSITNKEIPLMSSTET